MNEQEYNGDDWFNNLPTVPDDVFKTVEQGLDISQDYFNMDQEVGDTSVAFNLHYGGRKYRIGDLSHMGYVAGPSGTFKTVVAGEIIKAALTGKQALNFTMDIKGGDILYGNTELPRDVLYSRQVNMLMAAGLSRKPDNYHIMNVSSHPDPIQKKARLMQAIDRNPNLKLVVLDMIADLAASEGDKEMANIMTNDMVALCEKRQIMCLGISHVNQDGKLLDVLGRKWARKSSFGISTMKHGNKVFLTMSKTRYEPVPMTNFTFIDNAPVRGNYIPFGKIKID